MTETFWVHEGNLHFPFQLSFSDFSEPSVSLSPHRFFHLFDPSLVMAYSRSSPHPRTLSCSNPAHWTALEMVCMAVIFPTSVKLQGKSTLPLQSFCCSSQRWHKETECFYGISQLSAMHSQCPLASITIRKQSKEIEIGATLQHDHIQWTCCVYIST